jgi:hypothetical protein
MSGGGRRGEIRIRKARPVKKQAVDGGFNRAARRASKARQRPLVERSAAETEEFTRQRGERRRAEREAFWAGKTDADIQAMKLAESAAHEWDKTFLALMMVAVPGWVERHYRTDPDARVKRAHELGEVIAYSQGAATICDPDARCSEAGEIAKVFNAIAEGLAIGAYCPDGATFIGVNWVVSGAELRVTNGAFCSRHPLGEGA